MDSDTNSDASVSSSPQVEWQEYEPTARRGACSFVHDACFYLYNGYCQGSDVINQVPQVNLDVLDLTRGLWASVETTVFRSLPRNVCGACCTVNNGNLYIFGGWLAGRRSAELHELNLESLVWKHLPAKNPWDGPLCKDKAAMFSYGPHMVGVFGGYGYPHGRHSQQKGAMCHMDPSSLRQLFWTNELHLFHLERLEWLSPETSGVRPAPCAAFSLTQVDCHRLVLFGGKQLNERVNDLHILNLATWVLISTSCVHTHTHTHTHTNTQHWSGIIIPAIPEEPWPCGRSFHTACSLFAPSAVVPQKVTVSSSDRLEWLPCKPPDLSPFENCWHGDPKMLVIWGMDNNSDPINDAWELNVNTLSWKRVSLPPHVGPGRTWHCMAAHYPSPREGLITLFGGTAMNLFEVPDVNLPSLSKTTLIYCGIRSLLQLCLDVVIKEMVTLSAQLTQLPLHIQELLREQKETKSKLETFTTVRL